MCGDLYGFKTTLLAIKVRPPLTLKSGPRTETMLLMAMLEILMLRPIWKKIVGTNVCA
jgi:hypothetical protein